MDRRRFLQRVALGSAGLAALGCERKPRPAPAPHPPPHPPPPSDPAGSGVQATPPGEADWSALGGTLTGRLVLPDAPDYEPVHQLYDPRFDALRPAGITLCASEADVQRSLEFARTHEVRFAARCGGHSYGGYSSGPGLVCDVGRLASIEVNRAAGTAVVGAGARLIDVYAGVAAQGVALPGGTCPTVGIAGLTLGGGQGVLGRHLGLTCDNVTALRLVTASSEILTCDEARNADLFWACRGGGGGNFGVVTSFTFRVHEIGALCRFTLTWPWAAAADVVAAWQEWGPRTTDALWSRVHLLAAERTNAVSVHGVFVGSEAELAPQLALFSTRVGSAPRASSVGSATFLDTMLAEAGCSGLSLPECRLRTRDGPGKLGRRTQASRSAFFDRELSPAGIQALLGALDRGTQPLLATGSGSVDMNAFGGAINRVAADATAFVHRGSLFLAQCSTHWVRRAPPAVVDANLAWLDGFHAALRPHASGAAYQNYVDPRLMDWEQAYYGANLPRLRMLKARHDPGGLFWFPQGIGTG